MTELERFDAALASGQELPVLTGAEYQSLISEVNASALTAFDINELLVYGRYQGHGFGVNTSL